MTLNDAASKQTDYHSIRYVSKSVTLEQRKILPQIDTQVKNTNHQPKPAVREGDAYVDDHN